MYRSNFLQIHILITDLLVKTNFLLFFLHFYMMNHHRPVLKMHHILTDNFSSEKNYLAMISRFSFKVLAFDFFIYFLGELYRRRDPWYHGQEAQYPKHVGYCSRRPRQIYPDRFPFVQSWYHCWIKSW